MVASTGSSTDPPSGLKVPEDPSRGVLEAVHLSAPRDDLEMREVPVKTALTDCTYPGLDWSLNPYLGCAHACVFCYVPEVRHEDRADWGTYVHVKRTLPTVLAREVRDKERGTVSVSTATDPYQFAEARCKVTRRCLEVLARADWPVRVLTRSPLVTRDVDVFERFSSFGVGMSVPTFDDAARQALEPHAPSIEARLAALSKLADAGFPPYVMHAPAYPPTGGWDAARIADALADAGVVHVLRVPLRMRKGVRTHMLARLDGVEEAELREALMRITDPGMMGAYLDALQDELLARGIATGRTSP